MKNYPNIVTAIHEHLKNERSVYKVCKATITNQIGKQVYRFYLDTDCSARTLFRIKKRIMNKFGNAAGTVNFTWASASPWPDCVYVHSYKGQFEGPAFDLYI
jgi:hypothetical protein